MTKSAVQLDVLGILDSDAARSYRAQHLQISETMNAKREMLSISFVASNDAFSHQIHELLSRHAFASNHGGISVYIKAKSQQGRQGKDFVAKQSIQLKVFDSNSSHMVTQKVITVLGKSQASSAAAKHAAEQKIIKKLTNKSIYSVLILKDTEMFKKTVMASLFATALAGCSSMPGMESATVDRNEMSAALVKSCTELGSEYTPVSYAVDKVSKVMVSIQERQCAVFQDYRTLADKHADVAGFLKINADKSDEELLVAMNEFDEGKAENKKIRPQVEAYKAASDSIFDKNVELAKDIALEAAEIAIIASDNAAVNCARFCNGGFRQRTFFPIERV